MEIIVAFIFGYAFYKLVAFLFGGMGKKNTTDISRWKRSGMIVLTDHKTGLQYLKAVGGGITPRLCVDGSYMTELSDR